MTHKIIFLLCLFLILVQLLRYFRQKRQQNPFRAKQTTSKTPKPQMMRPKTEKDCPHCRAGIAAKPVSSVNRCQHSPIPWRQVKSRRDKKKTIRTQNYFCSNEVCAYYLITDQNIHALVGDGKHGKHEDIQYLIC